VRFRLALAIAFAAGACAQREPRLEIGALANGVAPFLEAHRRGPEQEIRVDEVARTGNATYHVVQVRGHGREHPHRHATHDLTVLVLRGRGTLHLDDTARTLAPGDVALVPHGAAHWFANESTADAVALVIFSPPLDAPDVVSVSGGVD
jgi:quercetin dioxygenase-like cupin family protein